jgi:hypothetical protein
MSKRTYKVWVHIEEFKDGEPIDIEADEPHEVGEYRTLEQAQKARDAAEAGPDMRKAYGKLHDMLSDEIEDGEITIKDGNYRKLVRQLSGPCLLAVSKAEGWAE